MKKRITLISLAVVALILVGLLSSLAFLTDEKNVTNTFTVGKVNITLTEPAYTEQDQKLLPGTVIAKDPTVTLVSGSEEAYVFMQIVPNGNIMNYLNTIAVDSTNWLLVDGDIQLYVYAPSGTVTAVAAASTDSSLPALFSQIVVNGDLDNSAFTSFSADNDKLTIRAYAHQARINGDLEYDEAKDAAIDWAS